jgi:hypothetical protein
MTFCLFVTKNLFLYPGNPGVIHHLSSELKKNSTRFDHFLNLSGLFQAMYNQTTEDRRFSLFRQDDPITPAGRASSGPSELFSVRLT